MAGSIVCGVDDTTGAQRATTVGVQLAVGLSRPLILVRGARGDRKFPYGDAVRRERRRHAAWQHGYDLIEELLSRHHGRTDIEGRIETGDPALELARVAEEEQAELLVVGSRERGEIRSAFLGSVSQALERLAPCPVVVVPPGPPESGRGQRARDETDVGDPATAAIHRETSAGRTGAALSTAGRLARAFAKRLRRRDAGGGDV